MTKPSPMACFDALYELASADGRGEVLFGRSIELARPAYERTLIGNGIPSFYLEFPLLGQPLFDILSVYGQVEPGAEFAENAGFGYQKMFDWFGSVCNEGQTVSCGIEVDTSSGETERAGVYLQHNRRSELVPPFLEAVGEPERARRYLDVLERMPDGWPPAYVGLFPGRTGTPLRIGGYLSRAEKDACADDASVLANRFDQIGFKAHDAEMLERCSEFMGLAPSIDFQFDIMPDGTLGPTFGLSLSFNGLSPRHARECMESGYGAKVMRLLQESGLADERWMHIARASFARRIPFEREDGRMGQLALCVLLNYAKVKFTHARPQPAKFYLLCKVAEL